MNVAPADVAGRFPIKPSLKFPAPEVLLDRIRATL
jgi:hypothetical protein